jgi:branched-chain amino acid transport system ATP-binding protein
VTHLLEVRDIHLSFKGVRAIDGISFHVDEGELFAIIGPNGAGKTSIFNCLNQVYQPQQGDILWKGKSLLGMKPSETAELGLARTFQNIALFPHMTVIENILTGRHIRMKRGWFADAFWVGPAKAEELENRAKAEDIIDFLEIEQWRKYPVGLLPYGVQKRVELGRALAMQPELLLLDEPVAGMNLEETEDMARFVLDIRDELDIAIVLVEHDMGLVMDIADRVMVVDFGKKIAEGLPAEVQQNPEVVRAYLGEEFTSKELAQAAAEASEAAPSEPGAIA